MLIDVQNTFCIPDFELYVGGRSGHGAVEDNIRLCEFIYRNLGNITHITATMDTHLASRSSMPSSLWTGKGIIPRRTPIFTLAELRKANGLSTLPLRQ